jgi:hypothetical protein
MHVAKLLPPWELRREPMCFTIKNEDINCAVSSSGDGVDDIEVVREQQNRRKQCATAPKWKRVNPVPQRSLLGTTVFSAAGHHH